MSDAVPLAAQSGVAHFLIDWVHTSHIFRRALYHNDYEIFRKLPAEPRPPVTPISSNRNREAIV